MSRISSFEYSQILARMSKNKARSPAPEDAVKREGDLHEQIIYECDRRGWIAFHGSMAHRTHRVEGEPDFVIFADAGRVIAVEAKARSGKLSTAQLGIIAWAKKLGHAVHVVTSLREFLEIANEAKP